MTRRWILVVAVVALATAACADRVEIAEGRAEAIAAPGGDAAVTTTAGPVEGESATVEASIPPLGVTSTTLVRIDIQTTTSTMIAVEPLADDADLGVPFFEETAIDMTDLDQALADLDSLLSGLDGALSEQEGTINP